VRSERIRQPSNKARFTPSHGRLAAVHYVQGFENRGNVRFEGFLGKTKLRCDNLVELARTDPLKHLYLAIS
jgi:hypothetical protein